MSEELLIHILQKYKLNFHEIINLLQEMQKILMEKGIEAMLEKRDKITIERSLEDV